MTAQPRRAPAPEPRPIFVRPGQVQAMFGISKTRLYRLVAEGRLHKLKLGACTFLRVEEIERLIGGEG
jgi:predicted DNA-binding transcriptional regulator AlpA